MGAHPTPHKGLLQFQLGLIIFPHGLALFHVLEPSSMVRPYYFPAIVLPILREFLKVDNILTLIFSVSLAITVR